MNTYLIDHKIKALAHLGSAFECRGYKLVAFESERPFASEEWLATKEVQAQNYQDASLEFRLGLIPIIDALSVLTQCSFSLLAMSYLARRLNDNAAKVFYLYIARDRRSLGMPFWQENHGEDLTRLLRIENKVALHYLREANNASTPKTRLAMLVFAAEALAGQITKTRKCKCGHEETFSSSDRELIERIVGSDAYEKLYLKNGGSLRHKLIHGNEVLDKDVAEVLPEVYDRIVLEYLPTEYGLTTMQRIVAAPRSFNGFEHGGLFLSPSRLLKN